jgi:hypothetical protein
MASFGGGPAASFVRPPQHQYASSGVPSQTSPSSKSPTINLITLAKASDVLNGLFEKDAQMVPELRDTLAGESASAIVFF